MSNLVRIIRNYAFLPAIAAAIVVAGCSSRTATVAQVDEDVPSRTEQTSPAPTATPEAAPIPQFTAPISWHTDWNKAFEAAKAQQKPVMVDFYADWCGPCKYLEKEIYTQNTVAAEAQNFISLKIDTDRHGELGAKYKVTALPTIMFFDAQGNVLDSQQGAPDAESLISWMQSVRTKVQGTPA